MSNGQVRRIITGLNTAGKSIITSDAPSPSIKSIAERPNYYSTDIWRTSSAPADLFEPEKMENHHGVSPPEGGTVLRVIEFPPEPEDKEEAARQLRASFGTIFQDADTSKNSTRHPGMHQTDTIDYAIILEGEIMAIMDEGETLMKAGDILVQRGTNHAWSNKSGAPCKIAFVLIDGCRN